MRQILGSVITALFIVVSVHCAGAVTTYGKVAIVATSGGDYSNPAEAMNHYYDWCGTPSANAPCLLKIMPGVYNVGTAPVLMEPYIDIEGSGEKTTKIISSIYCSWPPNTGTVMGANNAELRFLTVQNTVAYLAMNANSVAVSNNFTSPSILHVTAIASGGYQAAGISNFNSSPVITNVIASSSGGTYVNLGIYNGSTASPIMSNVTATASGGTYCHGIENNSSSPTLMNVTATCSGGNYNYGISSTNPGTTTMMNVIATASGGSGSFGVCNNASTTIMSNVTATASGSSSSGVYNCCNGTVKINHSVIKGTTNTINTPSPFTQVGDSQLDGGPVTGLPLTCVGAYNGNYVALGTNCH